MGLQQDQFASGPPNVKRPMICTPAPMYSSAQLTITSQDTSYGDSRTEDSP